MPCPVPAPALPIVLMGMLFLLGAICGATLNATLHVERQIAQTTAGLQESGLLLRIKALEQRVHLLEHRQPQE